MSAINLTTEPRTYVVRTLGCQMNVHDSEHLAGMLEQAGYQRAPAEAEATGEADIVVINTCAVRENASSKLYGQLGQLASVKAKRPGMQIAVGGCLAQKDRSGIVDRAPWVDVVLGTHNLDALPALLDRARHNNEAQVEIAESLQVFPSTLPSRRDSLASGWVSISVGCNNTCTFCIVPHLRGKERDRRPGQILAEVQALVAQGVVEITLLGQNVNSYGVEFGDRGAFAKLLRACGEIEGLERLRFTSPHPAAFTDDVIDAMAQTSNVMPTLHMPLQSGSDRILRAMRRSYRASKFLGILDRVREAMPDAAITTDIIVGFPGETEEDFQATLDVVEKSRFTSAYTFQYSQRPGTPAATLPDQLPKEVVQERYVRLLALQERISAELALERVGTTVEILVTETQGRKDLDTQRISGRSAHNYLVHVALPVQVNTKAPMSDDDSTGADAASVAALPQDPRLATNLDPKIPRPGDFVSASVTKGAPHHLIADSALTGGLYEVRRTQAGDEWVARERARLGLGGGGHHGPSDPVAGTALGTALGAGAGTASSVSLGMPTLRIN